MTTSGGASRLTGPPVTVPATPSLNPLPAKFGIGSGGLERAGSGSETSRMATPAIGTGRPQVGPPYRLRTLCRPDTRGTFSPVPALTALSIASTTGLDPRPPRASATTAPWASSGPGRCRTEAAAMATSRRPKASAPPGLASPLCLECQRIARVRQAARGAHLDNSRTGTQSHREARQTHKNGALVAPALQSYPGSSLPDRTGPGKAAWGHIRLLPGRTTRSHLHGS